jgi:hypothetical protein
LDGKELRDGEIEAKDKPKQQVIEMQALAYVGFGVSYRRASAI